VAEPEVRSPLDGHLAPGLFGAAAEDGPGVWLQEAAPRSLALVEAPSPKVALAPLAASLGIGAPPAAGEAVSGERGTALCTAPGQWLVVSATLSPSQLLDALRAVGNGIDAAAFDLSHARAVLALGGPRAVEVLAAGCPLDLEAMREDGCAATVLGPFNVVLHRRAARRWEVYVFTSLARALLDWIGEAALEHGLEVRARAGRRSTGAP
jgi:sarcosine oxidase subunit gamma